MIKMRNTQLSTYGVIELTISGGIINTVQVRYHVNGANFTQEWLTLGYTCNDKSVSSSTCFGRDYEFNEAMAMLTQEAFSIFGLENAYIDFLKDLGFEEA